MKTPKNLFACLLVLSSLSTSAAGFIYLQYPLYNEEIKNLTTSIDDIPANSWNPITAPHLDTQCGKFWVEESQNSLKMTTSFAKSQHSAIAILSTTSLLVQVKTKFLLI